MSVGRLPENNIAAFSKAAFRTCLPTFRKSVSGYGLDLVWPKLLGNAGLKMAVVESVKVTHPVRKLGGSELNKILPREDHKVEGLALAAAYGVDFSDWNKLFVEYGLEGSGILCRALARRMRRYRHFHPTLFGTLEHARERVRHAARRRLEDLLRDGVKALVRPPRIGGD